MSAVGSVPIGHNVVSTSECRREIRDERASSSTGLSRTTFRALSPVESEPDRSSSNIASTDFKILDDGTLIELVRHPGNPQRNLLAVWKEGTVRYEEKLESDGRIFIPMPISSDILKQIRLPWRPEGYSSTADLVLSIFDFLKRYVVLKEEYLAVLTHFVLSTWISDLLPIAPYISLVGCHSRAKPHC